MNENIKWIAAAVVVVGLSIGAVLYVSKNPRKPPVDEVPVAAKPKPAAPEEPAIAHPLPEPDASVPLPPLNESDGSMQGALTDLIGKQTVDQMVIPKSLARNFVVTVDNLSTEKVAERIRPTKPLPGKFEVSGSEEAPVLDSSNYARYKPLVELFRSTDTQRLVDTYTRYYPLFQEAYAELGHPPQYFNDRLIEVIDHLLAAPELQGPIALAQPSVMYEYADPKLESRSAGEKVLMRMGSENAKAVKAKLRELRSALAAQRPAS